MDDLNELLNTCEREQLHLSGAIQPHGVLLRIDAAAAITHASANSGAALGVEAPELLGLRATDIVAGIGAVIGADGAADGDRVALYGERLGDSQRVLDIALAKTPGGWLVELYDAAERGTARTALRAVPAFYRMRKQGVVALCEQIVDAVQRETGYEKVMAYRFHEDWSGEVLAEVSSNPNLDRYLGQRFPASDIPKIARDLYVKNPSRLIADVAAGSVPVIGRDAQPPDLTYSELRSVSPVHLQYLRNMQVGGSCSFAIVVRGELWGLVACHNAAPRSVPLWNRGRCVDYVKELAFAIATHETDQKMRFIDRIDAAIDKLLDGFGGGGDLAAALEKQSDQLLALVGATGGALVIDGRCERYGVAPGEREILNIVEMNAAEGLFVTDHLAGVFPAYDSLAKVASGALVVHAPRRSRSAGSGPKFAWFRAEEPQTIVWAGDPRKSVEIHDGERRISPRTSFASWTQMMEGRSKRWTPQDLIAAHKFRSSILRWAKP
jgi:light-regulated signal transduction histidine kinase (bacteriophytochrome)